MTNFVNTVISNIQEELYLGRKQASVIEEQIHAVRRDPVNEQEKNPIALINEAEIEEEYSAGYGRIWAIITAGAGLFSDGYVNQSISTVLTILGILYPVEYGKSAASSNIGSIAFVGIFVGMLLFGYIADAYSRKTGMLISTGILILFSILAAGSWGAKGSIYGMLAALTTYRFFIGIGLGGEYPAGSTASAEAASSLPVGNRNRYVVLATNSVIDFGFVVASFVPLVLLWICSDKHLTPVWRITIGLGAIPSACLFILRLKYKESPRFKRMHMKRSGVPWGLFFKYYWWRMTIISVIWFLYDYSLYSFGVYSSALINAVIKNDDMYKTFGWNVVLNLFYMPGAILGAYGADYLGPRLCLFIGLFLQGIIGFIIAALYPHLESSIAGFVVAFGIFQALGEFGPGNQTILLAARTSATPIRGKYYAICAAMAKVGAFVGNKTFPIIINHASYNGKDPVRGMQVPFYVSASLCLFSAFISLFFLPKMTQESTQEEDIKFTEYLAKNGFDVSLLGDAPNGEAAGVHG